MLTTLERFTLGCLIGCILGYCFYTFPLRINNIDRKLDAMTTKLNALLVKDDAPGVTMMG